VLMHVFDVLFMRGFACDKIGAAAWLFCIFTAVFRLRTQCEIASCFVYTMYVLDVSVHSFSLLPPPCHRA